MRRTVLTAAALALLLASLAACKIPGPPESETTPETNNGPVSAAPTVAGRAFAKPEQVVDPAKKYTATISTEKGEIVLDLLADKAPRTVNSFVFLAQQGFYNGLKFHRLVAGFIIQGGDPLGNGTGSPGYSVEEDANDLLNTRGTLSMAKATGSTQVGSQFFINLANNEGLDRDSGQQKRFYPFAVVTGGMDVVDSLKQGDVIKSVTIATK